MVFSLLESPPEEYANLCSLHLTLHFKSAFALGHVSANVFVPRNVVSNREILGRGDVKTVMVSECQ